MPVVLLLGDVQDNVRRILLANAIPVVPGATDRMVQIGRAPVVAKEGQISLTGNL